MTHIPSCSCHVVIMDWLGALSHIVLTQGPKLHSSFEALSEIKCPRVHQPIQLSPRSNITLAHISLIKASCWATHGIDRMKMHSPPCALEENCSYLGDRH